MARKTKLYLVDAISTFRIRYVVRAASIEDAQHQVKIDGEIKEFSQKHISEEPIDVRVIDEKEYLELFNKDNDYLKSWDKNQKLRLVNIVSYKQ
jgi:hypothetical protein